MGNPDVSDIFTDDVKNQLAGSQVDLIVLCRRDGSVDVQTVHGPGEEGVTVDDEQIRAVLLQGQTTASSTKCYWCTISGGKRICFEVPC